MADHECDEGRLVAVLVKIILQAFLLCCCYVSFCYCCRVVVADYECEEGIFVAVLVKMVQVLTVFVRNKNIN